MAVRIDTFLFIERCNNLAEVKEQVDQIVKKVSAASIGKEPHQCITDVQKNLNRLASPFKLETINCGFKLFKGSNYYLLEAPDTHTLWAIPADATAREKQEIYDNMDQFSSWFNFANQKGFVLEGWNPKRINALAKAGRVMVEVSGVYNEKDIDDAVRELGTDGRKIKPQLEAAFKDRKDELKNTRGNLGFFALPSSKI